MNDHGPETSLERLLTHRGFVRTLAMRLVRHASDAEDLAQDVWLSALETGPEVSSARSWLGRVVRNAAIDRNRSFERRHRREAQSAVPEVQSSDDVVARAEAHRRVVLAVLDSREPFRTVVLLRYFEGLTLSAVAKRLGVPLETVRTRLKRAHEQLRTRLGEPSESDPRGLAWLLPLTVPLETKAVSSSLGVCVMLMAKILLGSLAIGAGFHFIYPRTDDAVTGLVLEETSRPVAAPGLAVASDANGSDSTAPRPSSGEVGEDPRPVDGMAVVEQPSSADALKLTIGIEPLEPRCDEPITLTARIENVSDRPVKFFLPFWTGRVPFPRWTFTEDSGRVFVPSASPFQTMLQKGIQGVIVELLPGGAHVVAGTPDGFEVEYEDGFTGPMTPIRPGIYRVSASYVQISDDVPFDDGDWSNPRRRTRQKVEGLFTGTINSQEVLLTVRDVARRRFTLRLPDPEDGHRLTFEFSNPETGAWKLSEPLTLHVYTKVGPSATAQIPPLDRGSATVGPGASLERAIDLRELTFSDRRREVFGRLYDFFPKGTVAIHAVMGKEEERGASSLVSNGLLMSLTGARDLSGGDLVFTVTPGGGGAFTVTLENRGRVAYRVPKEHWVPRTLGISVFSDVEEPGARLIERRMVDGTSMIVVPIAPSWEQGRSLERGDHRRLEPGEALTRRLTLAELCRRTLPRGSYIVECEWRNHDLGGPALSDAVTAVGFLRGERMTVTIE